MTKIDPRVFQTLDPLLCTHLILVQSPVSDADQFNSTLSADTRKSHLPAA